LHQTKVQLKDKILYFQKLASLNVSLSVKHVFLNRTYTFTYGKRDMYGLFRMCSDCLKKTNLKIMYKRRNFQQKWYGKGQFQMLLYI